jgi:hypothetical protein
MLSLFHGIRLNGPPQFFHRKDECTAVRDPVRNLVKKTRIQQEERVEILRGQ